MADLEDANLMQAFLEEAKAYLPQMEEHLALLRVDAGNETARTRLRWLAHDLRGAGAVVGLREVAAIAAGIEDVCQQLAEGQMAFDDSLAELLRQGLGRMHDSLAAAEVVPGEPASRRAEHSGSGQEPDPENIPPDVLEAVLAETVEHLRAVGVKLFHPGRESETKQRLLEARRSVHTIKGATGMAGLAPVSRIAHRMEDLLDMLYAQPGPPGSEHLQLLYDTYDLVTDAVIARGAVGRFRERMAEIEARYDLALTRETTKADRQAAPGAAEPEAAAGVTPPPVPARPAGEIPIDRLDSLMELLTESSAGRSAFGQELGRHQRQVAELNARLQRLRTIVARIAAVECAGQDPGGQALWREVLEAAGDAAAAGVQLEGFATGCEDFLDRQSQLASEVHDKVLQLRLAPLTALSGRLTRTVQAAARELGKQAGLEILPSRVRLDRELAERLTVPLEHLLRNAVAHGIEPPEARIAAGKPIEGRIVLTAWQEGTAVTLRLEDDGAGVDVAGVRREVVRRGIHTEAEAAAMTEEEILNAIFAPGLSTVRQADSVCGRGIGLDVVKSSIEGVGGVITAASRPGAGACFEIRLPRTTVVTRVLLVSAGGQPFALPLGAIKEAVTVQPGQADTACGAAVLRLDGRIIPVVRLDEALSMASGTAAEAGARRAVLIEAGAQEYAIEVDRVFDARDAVVKPPGRLWGVHPAIEGATALGDGTVALVLNPAALAAGFRGPAPDSPRGRPRRRAVLNVLIVDDSPLVRRTAAHAAREAGWNPVLAGDGREAIEILSEREEAPDAIVLDLEMPRMDGFQLAAWLRRRPAYEQAPIVALTSNVSEQARREAIAAGAACCVEKPLVPEALIEAIRRAVEPAG